MTHQFLQIYQEINNWKEGDHLEKNEVVAKEETHEKDLLHLSVHLLIVDFKNRILSRKRKPNDFRYADLWTSTIGTHVFVNSDYLSTLQDLLPLQKDLEYIGEFRVHDEWENEINGLYIMRADEGELSAEFLGDKSFFTIAELSNLVDQDKTTPHLKGGFELLKQKFFKTLDS